MNSSTGEQLTADEPRRTRSRRIAALLIALALAIVATVVLATYHPGRAPKFCTADGRIGPNPGQIYGRDANQDCKVVDEHGNVLPEQYQ